MQLGVHFILRHLQLTTVQLKYVEMSLLSWADLIHLMHSLLFGLLACLWCSTEFTYSSAWPALDGSPEKTLMWTAEQVDQLARRFEMAGDRTEVALLDINQGW